MKLLHKSAADKAEAKSVVEEAASSDSKVSNSAEECDVQASADKTDSKSVSEEQQATSTTEKTETKEKDGAVVTTTTKVTTRTVSGAGSSASKPASPFAKFHQLDKQNSQQSPKSPSTPTTPGGTASPSGSARIFQFTDPALNARAATVKEQLLQWCQSKTQEYENVQITNFSASWSDGLAFCALIHHFLPDAFDYSKLTPKSRRHNFELAFTVADEKAGIAPLLDVEDMVEMKRPDWKCVFIYVQSIYRRFRNCQ
ncbi:PREDICTED: smoothelin-like protein 1 isoform X2 [Rhagoletis zephyria]|uniref:smoothelin-like protein 1 isoform X1 n=1 Tax=Rhagoletis zephyria TaxID=28612 RepID=UPI0008118B6B|nr:PREDICTED: smoothelin-like protein 1 isoform X1 [Rhagoletis zephyria]XP_017486718.1 PREDICTED: smoothelin-like protein 1 isoform X2 [Rhagoletis zephyria]